MPRKLLTGNFEVVQALLWVSREGWPSSKQDLALASELWAEVLDSDVPAERQSLAFLIALHERLPRLSADEDELLHRMTLIRVVQEVWAGSAPDHPPVSDDDA